MLIATTAGGVIVRDGIGGVTRVAGMSGGPMGDD
jgi:hypothetical protein